MSLRKGNTLISGAGKDGANGVDGFSPTASVSKSGSVSTLTVTDAIGTTTTEILDGGQVIQYVTMPTASADNLGDILQFVGTTDSTYTNGFYYKCVSDGEVTPTYSWEQINVQPDGNYVRRGNFNFPSGNYQKIGEAFDEDAQWLIDYYVATSKVPPYMNGGFVLTNIGLNNWSPTGDTRDYRLYFNRVSGYGYTGSTALISEYKEIMVYTHYSTYDIYDSTDSTYYPRTWISRPIDYIANSDYVNANCLTRTNNSAFTPTGDYNPATKKYVDDGINNSYGMFKRLPNVRNYDENKLIKYIGSDTNYNYGKTYKKKVAGNINILNVNSASKFLLGYQFQDTDRLEIEFKYVSSSIAHNSGVLGNIEQNYSYPEIHFSSSGTMYFGTGSTEKNISGFTLGTLYTVIMNEGGTGNTGNIIVNDETKFTNQTFASNGTLQLFEYNNNAYFRGEFHYLRIYDKTTGNLKKEWLPAVDSSDNVCLLETVGNTYVYNSYTESTPNTITQEPYYVWAQYNGELEPNVISNTDSTYTITNLKEHELYNLGEITSLTISAVSDVYLETDIFLESGSTATTVSLPTGYTHFGDAPTFTTASDIDSGTLDTNKKYVISVLNGVFIWKKG